MAYLSKRVFLTSILSGIILGVGFSVYSGYVKKQDLRKEKTHETVSFQKVSVIAEVADNEATRVQGLSGKSLLKEGEGMWFDFKSDGRHSIWMKEMNFPIDIIWFNKNFQIIFIKEKALPESYPEVFTPNSFDRFVLEVPSGFVEKYEVSLGQKVTVHKTP